MALWIKAEEKSKGVDVGGDAAQPSENAKNVVTGTLQEVISQLEATAVMYEAKKSTKAAQAVGDYIKTLRELIQTVQKDERLS